MCVYISLAITIMIISLVSIIALNLKLKTRGVLTNVFYVQLQTVQLLSL